MAYRIYKMTSPNERSYVGCTSQSIKERWRQHCTKAKQGLTSELWQDIRHYGKDAFVVDVLSVFEDKTEAIEEEIHQISLLVNPYNISRGGFYDSSTGVAKLKQLLKDPEWKAQYSVKLSEGCRNSGAHNAHHKELAESGRQWRKEHPEEAEVVWKRGLEAANIKNRQDRLPREIKERLSRTEAVAKQWRDRTPEQIQALKDKISASVKRHHAAKTQKQIAEHNAQLAEARKNIDHTVRKENQQQAIREYWTDEKRIEKSKELREGENYANVRHNQFRTKE